MITLILAERWHMTPENVRTMRNGPKWAARQAALDEAREKSREIHTRQS